MKTLSIIAISITLAGCGWWSRVDATVTGIAKTCVDGVVYLQFASGSSVAYTPDGKIKTCN